MNNWLSLKGVHFSYNSIEVFKDFSLKVGEEDPVLVILGENGIGKSTLTGLLAGHILPDRGIINILGERVVGPSHNRPVVFQDHNLFPWKTVYQNVEFGLKCAGIPSQQRRPEILNLLKRFKLERTEGLFPSMLSGGMKQKVGLARAIAVSPKCILMDEPFSSLDNEIKEQLYLQVSQLVAEKQIKIVFVTHELSEAVFLGNQICILRDGTKIAKYRISYPPHPRDIRFKYSEDFLQHLKKIKEVINFR